MGRHAENQRLSPQQPTSIMMSMKFMCRITATIYLAMGVLVFLYPEQIFNFITADSSHVENFNGASLYVLSQFSASLIFLSVIYFIFVKSEDYSVIKYASVLMHILMAIAFVTLGSVYAASGILKWKTVIGLLVAPSTLSMSWSYVTKK